MTVPARAIATLDGVKSFVAAPATTVTAFGSAPLTVTVVVADLVTAPCVAVIVIVDVPGVSPSTTPAAVTLATAVLLEE